MCAKEHASIDSGIQADLNLAERADQGAGHGIVAFADHKPAPGSGSGWRITMLNARIPPTEY